jgi:dTDP-4-amino-4,6-dideoxygalactose transaminase
LSLFDVKNREVIVPSLSFVSTAHAVTYNGGRAVFVDIDAETLCLDASKIEKAITKRTKAIMPVHLAGLPCELKQIQELCDKFGLVLVEDAAHAAGASYKNKKIGYHGDAVCFSFHPVKNLAMPTGGAVTLNGKNSEKFAETLKIRRWCGISNRKDVKYDITDIGWNFYMNEFSAAIGIEQLKRLDKMNKKRKEIAKRYSTEIFLEDKMPYNSNCVYHFYWIRVKRREQFMRKMKQKEIETGIHYNPIHKMKFYDGKWNLPITEKAGQEIVSLPSHPNLSDADVTKIIEAVNQFS